MWRGKDGYQLTFVILETIPKQQLFYLLTILLVKWTFCLPGPAKLGLDSLG